MICPGFIQTDISKSAFRGDGKKHGEMDDGQANGMAVDVAVKKILQAISKQKKEVYVGGFKETRLAMIIMRLFPALFHRILRKTKVN